MPPILKHIDQIERCSITDDLAPFFIGCFFFLLVFQFELLRFSVNIPRFWMAKCNGGVRFNDVWATPTLFHLWMVLLNKVRFYLLFNLRFLFRMKPSTHFQLTLIHNPLTIGMLFLVNIQPNLIIRHNENNSNKIKLKHVTRHTYIWTCVPCDGGDSKHTFSLSLREWKNSITMLLLCPLSIVMLVKSHNS